MVRLEFFNFVVDRSNAKETIDDLKEAHPPASGSVGCRARFRVQPDRQREFERQKGSHILEGCRTDILQ